MTRPTITIERLPDERAERYQARVEYITMGANRSQEAVSQKLGKSRQLISRWSAEDDWTTHALKYDETVYTLAAQAAADDYRRNLEAHRKKAMDAGRSLFSVAGQLLQQVNVALAEPKKIKGADGKLYTLHGIDLNSNSLSIAARALTAALDLEAHALGVDKLLPSLTNDSEQ